MGAYDERTQKLFKHVLCSSGIWSAEEEPLYVPLPYNLIRKYFRGADIETLISNKLLLVKDLGKGVTYHDGRARRVCVSPRIMLKYQELSIEDKSDKRVNLFTGKTTTRRIKHAYKDKGGNQEPRIMRDAWKIIKPARFDRSKADNVLQVHKNELDKARTDINDYIFKLNGIQCICNLTESKLVNDFDNNTYENIKDLLKHCSLECGVSVDSYNSYYMRYQKAIGRLCNDSMALFAITTGAVHVEGNIYRNQEMYCASSTGRSTAMGGMFQNCSREMKQALFGDIELIYNYDMESSQDRILLEFFKLAGIKCEWLEDALDGRDFKSEISCKTGLSRDTVKRCLHALKMGANLSSTCNCKVFKYINDEVGDYKAIETMNSFKECVSPIYESINDWHNYLLKVWISENCYRGYGHKRYVKNHIGKTFCIDDCKKSELSRKLAAFLLQGREAHFVYELTLTSEKHNFSVVSLQHDGMITEGEIPECAIEEARVKTGMKYVKLVTKPFV